MDMEEVVSRVLPKYLGENTGLTLVCGCPAQIPHINLGVEQLQVSPSSKNVSSRMVANNNADTVATHPAVSTDQMETEEYEGVYCSWDRLI